jgi:biotin synthase
MPNSVTTISLRSKSRAARSGPWTQAAVAELLDLPFNDLLHRAHSVHREHFDPNAMQISTLLSIKTGGCPEDCGYCSQSARHASGVANEPLLSLEAVQSAARAAKNAGATRFCMGAAWRGPKQRDLDAVLPMIRAVKEMGLETCVTLGLLRDGQAAQLKEAGLDYYNHNLDAAREFYGSVIGTRSYDDRLETLRQVREAGMHVCCGGIVGMGETRAQRAALIAELANLDPAPESVPINDLVPVEGTPLAGAGELDWTEIVRTIAAARITMPQSHVRLSAGRLEMSEAEQALCFHAGANSIFYGEKLLTTGNPEAANDLALLDKLGMRIEANE